MRAIRCKKCQQRFYTLVPADTCQSCEGSHDDFANAKRDAENIRKVNRVHRASRPQSVDPRTGMGAGETTTTTETAKNGKGSK